MVKLKLGAGRYCSPILQLSVDHSMASYPEAQAFAQEALAETKLPLPPSPDSDTASRLSSLSHNITRQATELLNSLQGAKEEIERLYSELSCVVSECRHLRSLAAESLAEPEQEPRVKRQRLDSVQRLPNELVLWSLQFASDHKDRLPFRVFPRLNRSTNRLSVSSPEWLGVLQLFMHQFPEPVQPKPRFLGCVDTTIRPF